MRSPMLAEVGVHHNRHAIVQAQPYLCSMETHIADPSSHVTELSFQAPSRDKRDTGESSLPGRNQEPIARAQRTLHTVIRSREDGIRVYMLRLVHTGS